MEAQMEWHGSECDAADFGWDSTTQTPNFIPVLLS